MKKDIFELTNPQKSIWMTEKFFDGTNINNICATLTIKEDVKLDNLSKAINLCIKNNKSLRLKFKIEEGNIKQYFDEYQDSNFEQIKLKNEEEVKKFAKKLSKEVFDIEKDVLFKFKLYKLENGYGGFIIVIHHIISDAATLSIMAKDIMDNYNKIINNEDIQEKDYSYEDYINEEQEYLKGSKFLKDKEYWDSIYETIPEVASIPQTLENDGTDISISALREGFQIDKDTLERISEFCKNNKVSNFNFFMAVYAIYLGRVSNLNDFVIGTPILNRTNFKEKHTTGMFINTAPLRIKIEDNIKFIDFVKNIAQSSLSMLRYQKYPYQMLLEDLRRKDSSIPTLYDVILSYQVTKANDRASNIPYEINWIETDTISNGIYIHLHDNDDNGTLNVEYDYQVKKYQKEDIVNLHKRILNIIKQVLENDNCLEKDIEIVTKEEKDRILNEFNNTYTDYPRDKTIVDLFEEQVQKTPDNIAVVFEEQKLTYRELNEKANSLAHYLVKQGIGANSIVGILLNRSIEMIVSIIALLKSGGAYIPMDPDYPADRISYMLDDSKCKFILSNKEIYSKLNIKAKLIDVSQNNIDIYNKSIENLNIKIDENSLSYIIYTSGSTGKPKGVMLKHKGISNLTNYCNNYIEYLRDNKYKTIVSVTTISFDIFFFESIISLQKGLKLVIANQEEQTIPRLLENLIKKEGIEIIQTTPSRMKLLLDNVKDKSSISNLKYITLAGEQYPITLAEELRKIGDVKLYNGYGPSETTVFSTLTDVTSVKKMTIGKPLNNTQIYIVDSNMKLLPIGVPGEICISGHGVGNGYINKEDLNRKSFVQNPFNSNSLLYKTGDLGFYNENGTITCLGRVDNQIKIRGLRIELEEIEKAILEIKEIKDCVVVKKKDDTEREFLCAYYVKKLPIEAMDIRKKLQKVLTNYMIPQYFVELDKFPYTPNGKIDKKLLPIPKRENNKKIIKPENNEEMILKEIFEEVLHQKNISTEDNFFQLGGDSLTAINLSTKIYDKFNMQIGIKHIFNNPTVKSLANILKNENIRDLEDKIIKIKEKDYYPVSSAQRRIYYSTLIDGKDSILYNISGGLILDEIPDVERLNKCFKRLVEKNESLRTYFEVENNKVVQKISKNVEFNIETEKVKNSDIEEITRDFIKPFNLSVAPLIRVKLTELKNGKGLLLIDMHHIIGDGATLEILTKEISDLYNGKRIDDKKIDYKDFAIWEHNNINSKKYKEAEEYWLSQFKGEIPILELPTNYTRPAMQSFEGEEVTKILDGKITNQINNICIENNVTPFMLLISIYYVLLSIYSRTEDIVVGTPISGRYNEQTSNIIGMFVNTLALRNNVDSKVTFKEFINQVKEQVLTSFEYQNYPLDDLIKK